MLAASTRAAVNVVHFILRSPDLFRVTVSISCCVRRWASVDSVEISTFDYVWVHLGSKNRHLAMFSAAHLAEFVRESLDRSGCVRLVRLGKISRP